MDHLASFNHDQQGVAIPHFDLVAHGVLRARILSSKLPRHGVRMSRAAAFPQARKRGRFHGLTPSGAHGKSSAESAVKIPTANLRSSPLIG